MQSEQTTTAASNKAPKNQTLYFEWDQARYSNSLRPWPRGGLSALPLATGLASRVSAVLAPNRSSMASAELVPSRSSRRRWYWCRTVSPRRRRYWRRSVCRQHGAGTVRGYCCFQTPLLRPKRSWPCRMTDEMRDIVASEGLTPRCTLSINPVKSSIYCTGLVHTSTVTCFAKPSSGGKWACGSNKFRLGSSTPRVNGTLVPSFLGLRPAVCLDLC